jgi:hypothetical protein
LLGLKAYLLLDLERIHGGSEFTKNLVGLLVELQLGGDQIGQVAQGLGGIKDLVDQGVVNTGVTSKTKGDKKHTFFITLTASSVWPTNSSSACSISWRASSLKLSKSP